MKMPCVRGGWLWAAGMAVCCAAALWLAAGVHDRAAEGKSQMELRHLNVVALSPDEVQASEILESTYSNWCENVRVFYEGYDLSVGPDISKAVLECRRDRGPLDVSVLDWAVATLLQNPANADSIAQWYSDIAGMSVPTNMPRREDNYGMPLIKGRESHREDGFDTWIGVKGNVLSRCACFVREMTNAWMSVAREHGAVIAWLRDYPNMVPQCGGRGGCFWSSRWCPRYVDRHEFHRWPPEYRLEYARVAPTLEVYQDRLIECLSEFACSEVLLSLSVDVRNAIVSNIVETARLTAAEASSLGLMPSE